MNSIYTVAPRKPHGIWVFDDPARGLASEAFVASVNPVIEHLTKDIKDAEEGFNLLFSASFFPNHAAHLEWKRSEGGGNWYRETSLNHESWFCPALFKYFDAAPKELFGAASALAQIG